MPISSINASENVKLYIPNAKTVGEGRFKFLMWNLYDAKLYAENGTFNKDQSFALELSYLRDLSGKKIADQSAEEMRKIGAKNEIKLATWHSQMRDIFPDVEQGEEITAIKSKNTTIFYKNSLEIGRIKDIEFSQYFFDIWLSKDTSTPNLRKKLLGMV